MPKTLPIDNRVYVPPVNPVGFYWVAVGANFPREYFAFRSVKDKSKLFILKRPGKGDTWGTFTPLDYQTWAMIKNNPVYPFSEYKKSSLMVMKKMNFDGALDYVPQKFIATQEGATLYYYVGSPKVIKDNTIKKAKKKRAVKTKD